MTMPHGSAPPTGPEPLSGGTALGPAAGDPARVLAVLGRSWTWIMGAAIATLVPGVLVLVWPDETLHVLAVSGLALGEVVASSPGTGRPSPTATARGKSGKTRDGHTAARLTHIG